MTQITGTDQLLTGWGKTAPTRSQVLGPLDLEQLQHLVTSGPDRGLTRQAFDQMYPDLAGWRAVRAKFDPAGVFRSDLGRRVGLC
jgi:D-arabinono-1,4-lactone oxidase